MVTDDVPEVVEVPSVDLPDKDNLALLLGKDAGWPYNVDSVDPRLVDA